MRKQETTINEKGKFDSKAKAGKSISYSAPATLLTMIDNKLISRGYNQIVKVEVDKEVKITDKSRIDMAESLYLQLEK